ncbi:uncharacterized protein LOC124199654 [Daphnia pulex]|uniref:uncharacterized protein LOC124199654 n=1 Tax=Daphnia pulex TaxID=6669 RepID=UPI001EE0E4B5|nr:uncharacterized protein LOC124199654 [Daphnia pulex]
MTYFNKRVGWIVFSAMVSILLGTSWMIYFHQRRQLCSTSDAKAPIAPWNYKAAESMSAEEVFRYLHWTNGTSCLFAVDFGFFVWNGEGVAAPDGHKAICLDQSISPVYGNCLVYSFGIGNQWSFDESMAHFGCNVYSFDPSMGDNDHDESQNIHFYNLGLAAQDGIIPSKQWKMKTASSVYQMLIHRHGPVLIDVFKMDIEFFEWEVIPQMMHSGFLAKIVKQLAVEIHFNVSDPLEIFRHRVRILQDLEESSLSSYSGGFIRFSSRPNPWLKRQLPILESKEDYIGLELAWYNSRYYPTPQS